MSDTAGQVSDETLAELRRLAAEATPGPWAWDADGDSYMGCGEVFTWGEGVEGGNIAAPSGDLYPRSGYSPQSDMRFIAAADPPTVLALLDTVDALRAEVTQLQRIINGYDRTPAESRAAEAEAERDAACERLARVEALHVPYAPRPYGTAPLLKYTCRHDRMPWPCRTIAALADTAKEAMKHE